MRIFSTLFTLGLLGSGAWYINEHQPDLKHKALEWANIGAFQSFEARFTPKQVMEKERKYLLKNSDYKFASTSTYYHPCSLLEVKFTTSDQTTGEGVILWDLVDGEMILSTKSWEKTHGYSDCIHSRADEEEFTILNVLSENGGKATRQTLLTSLGIDTQTLNNLIARCKRKKLIVKDRMGYRIHLKDPKLQVTPSTKVHTALVTRPTRTGERRRRRFALSQIEKVAEASFGSDFAIRNISEVFLPVYNITVQKPDGSLETTHWNGYNGLQLNLCSIIE